MKNQIRGFLLILGGILAVFALNSTDSWTAAFKQLLVACGGAAVAYGIGMAIGWASILEQFSLERIENRKQFLLYRVLPALVGVLLVTALIRFNPL